VKEKKRPEIIIAIIMHIIGLAFVNTMMLWRMRTHGVVLETWTNILWAMNLSIILQLVGNIVLVFYRPARLYSFVQTLLTAASLLSIVVFLIVFPLDFQQIEAGWLNALLRVMIIIAMVGGSIGVIVYIVRAITGTQYTKA
jgi:hypothetical protein